MTTKLIPPGLRAPVDLSKAAVDAALDRYEDHELVMEMLSRGFVVMRAKDLEGKL